MGMTDAWVRSLGLSTLFLGASFHRLFLYFFYLKSRETRYRELSVFLGLLSVAFLWFLFGIWGSFQSSYDWSIERVEELGPFLSLGAVGGILLSVVVSFPGKSKIIGVVLASLLFLFPFFSLPRIFQGWIPVWDSLELGSMEIIKMDREGTGVILTYSRIGAVYAYLPERKVTLQIRERSLSLGYRLFFLPPLYCKIEAVGTFILKTISNEADLYGEVIQLLPHQKERMVFLTLESAKVFTSYSIRCNSKGKYTIEEK